MKLEYKTKRLKMRPMTDEELQQLIDNTIDDDQKQAYSQMLEGCKANPGDRQWYAPWAMELKSSGKHIGEIGFRGPVANESVEIGYGVRHEFESKGYATEAAQGMISWAFEDKRIFFVEAETTEGNLASVKILEGQGFVRDGEGEEGTRFVKTRPFTKFATVYMSIGLCLGMSVGTVAFDNITLGMCVGMLIGFCVGFATDKKTKKSIEDAVARRQAKNNN